MDETSKAARAAQPRSHPFCAPTSPPTPVPPPPEMDPVREVKTRVGSEEKRKKKKRKTRPGPIPHPAPTSWCLGGTCQVTVRVKKTHGSLSLVIVKKQNGGFHDKRTSAERIIIIISTIRHQLVGKEKQFQPSH
ncbi:unnamed protein product [Pleuronectes platessa]|uniref:Uncharacterized protein n=1 Tax=Pleuronectes platessa TaxID=8262 RepID=A0A9N7VJZ5_PLEPL|nr:unnamed protein product [Pleuronectes platessa]